MYNQLIKQDIFDYQYLMSVLTHYKSPRSKVTSMLKKGEIIRVKKGLYVLGEQNRNDIISLEFLSNLIYGPSYLSLEYALSYYNFIPEGVKVMTSVTTERSKEFNTPVGRFTYARVPKNTFFYGMDSCQLSKNIFLIATPEKALVDFILTQKKMLNNTQKELELFLLESSRIEISDLKRLNINEVENYTHLYKSKKIYNLFRLICKFRKRMK